MNDKYNIFTIKAPGILDQLRSHVGVANPSNKDIAFGTMAVWDTGSPICFISEKLRRLLNLEFSRELPGYGIFAKGSINYGLVSIRLVARGRFFDVMAAVTPDLHRGPDCQAIIGMNIITKGQLMVSFKDNSTIFSFSIPAVDNNDLVDTAVSNDLETSFGYIDTSDDFSPEA